MDRVIGEEFIKNDGSKITAEQILEAECVVLYFSALWAPPSLELDKDLVEFCNEVNQGSSKKKIEVIFISCDNKEEEFNEHFEALPFTAIPFEAHKIAHFEDLFEASSIPKLLLLKRNGMVSPANIRTLIKTKGIEAMADFKILANEE
jgi:nucleoredoxin